MHGIGKGSASPSAEDTEVFSSLILVEPKDRVTVRLDERMLHLEGRKVSNSIRLSSIDQIDHRSTTWVPGWTIFLGLVSLWIGVRVMLDPVWKGGFIVFGGALLVLRVMSRRPTMLVHTSQGDVHALLGSEARLYHLKFMLKKLLKWNSMTLARQSWERHQSDSLGIEPNPRPASVDVLQTPHAIKLMLHEHNEDANAPESDEEVFEPDWKPTDEPQPSDPFLPTFMPVHGHLHATEVAQYPPRHHPRPTGEPVLIPSHVIVPNMHQSSHAHGTPPQTFIPSFWGQEQAHIPSTPELPSEDDLGTGVVDLDAEILSLDDVNEPEQSNPQPASPLQQRPKTVLVRRTSAMNQSSFFIPKRQQGLRPRRSGPRNIGTLLRDALETGLDRVRNRPDHQTVPELRNTAQRNSIEQHQPFTSLEATLGPGEIERLNSNYNSLQERTALQSEGIAGGLEVLSFNELEATTDPTDDVDLHEL